MKMRRAGDDKGTVLITVAMSLFLIMGVAALAIDAGMGYNERRSTQAAADHAALAAAWEACTGGTHADAVSRGEQAAADNHYDEQVTVNTVPSTAPNSFVYEAEITSTGETAFAKAIGQDDLTVASNAAAECLRKIWGGGYAIFAIGDDGCNGSNAELILNGDFTIEGGIHSNGDLETKDGSMDGSVTYSGDKWEDKGDMTFTPSDPQELPSSVPDPHQIDFDQFRPENNEHRNQAAQGMNATYFSTGEINNGWLAGIPGNSSSGGNAVINRSGVYYASTEIKNVKLIMGTDINTGEPAKVTLVSAGPVKVTSGEFHAYEQGVAIYSNHRSPASCGNKAVDITWSTGNWTGLIYAPRGTIKMSIASGATFAGAIVGLGVDIPASNGHTTYVSYTDVTGGGPEYEMELQR